MSAEHEPPHDARAASVAVEHGTPVATSQQTPKLTEADFHISFNLQYTKSVLESGRYTLAPDVLPATALMAHKLAAM